MDKYQESLLKRTKRLSLNSIQGNGKVEFRDSEIVLTQNNNYNITKYVLCIVNDAIESIQIDDIVINGNDTFEIDIDFDKKAKKIIFTFKNGFANPCVFYAKYIEANKAQYDSLLVEQNTAACLQKMNATCRTGLDLVNIYWNKASAGYFKTKVSLYAYVENQKREYLFMQEYEIEDNVFYKSITGLAFGNYRVIISQFDSNNNLIVSTELSFSINNFFAKGLESLASKLNEVKGQVKASGRHIVCN